MTIPNHDNIRNMEHLVAALRQRGVSAIHQWRHPTSRVFMVDIKMPHAVTMVESWHTVSGGSPETALDNALEFVKENGPEWPPRPNPNLPYSPSE